MAPVAAENGMVVTAQHLATEVGVDVLQAAAATPSTRRSPSAMRWRSSIPAAGNLGGGGFMTLQLADGRKTFLDFREKAPLAATANMYLDAAGNVIKGSTTTGHLAVGVPGTVSGLEMALAKYGTHEARRPDRAGDPLRRAGLRPRRRRCRDVRDRDRSVQGRSGDDGDLPQAGGQPYVAGDRLVQKDLGATLRQIGEAGAAGFYKGPVARRSSPRAAPARASSPRPTSTSTRRASWRRSSATTAAFTSSRRRRRARAASSSARSSTSSRAIRSRTGASARRRRCTCRSRRCAMPTSTATATSAIRTSSRTRSTASSTRPTPPRSAPPSTRRRRRSRRT